MWRSRVQQSTSLNLTASVLQLSVPNTHIHSHTRAHMYILYTYICRHIGVETKRTEKVPRLSCMRRYIKSVYYHTKSLWSILEDKWMRTRESAPTSWVVRVVLDTFLKPIKTLLRLYQGAIRRYQGAHMYTYHTWHILGHVGAWPRRMASYTSSLRPHTWVA